MEIHLISKEENEALDAFETVQDAYMQKFGEDSLDTGYFDESFTYRRKRNPRGCEEIAVSYKIRETASTD